MKEETKKEKHVKEIKTEQVSDNKVLIEKATLDNILERLANVESANPVRRITKIGNRTAKLRTVNGKIIKGYGKSWDKVEVGGRKFMVIEVIDIDGVKHEIEYLKFLEQGETIPVEILSIEKEEVEDTLGEVNPTKVDYDNYRTEILDRTVPLKVVTVNHIYKVKLPDGTEMTLPSDALN